MRLSHGTDGGGVLGSAIAGGAEMIASSAILSAVHARFVIAWERPYWGNLLYPGLSHVSASAGKSPDAERILGTLIEREKVLVREGAFLSPLFIWLVGQKPS